nr:MAG TPA: hypothetical protein [Caudoviricetes sp.]
MPTVNANKHTAHDLQLAGQMRREDYKTIKHMDKATLAAYLSRVWKRGYDAGYQAPRGLQDNQAHGQGDACGLPQPRVETRV